MDRKNYYDAEPWYRREKTTDWYQQMEKSNIAIMEKLAETINEKSVVTEVACGGGWLAMFIATLKPKKYRGFDFAETAANNASLRLQKINNFVCLQGDALSPDVYDPQTNLIFAHQFLHCLIGNDRKRWMGICQDILKRNSGLLLLSSMIGLPEPIRATVDVSTRINRPGNRYYAEDDEIQFELQSVGFKVIEIL